MASTARRPVLVVTAIILGLIGLALLAAGIWLIVLGGSWYYAIAGLALLVNAVLFWNGNPAALWLYALVLLGTLLWSLWEVGLDWWPLAPRGDVLFIIGLLLLTPWIARALRLRGSPSGVRGGRIALGIALLLSLGVGVAAWFNDPTRIDGMAPDVRAEVPPDALGVPAGEWHAYGRTGYGQRWSPLNQITPENVGNLQVAWTFRTGDMRGQPGDPVETTFQVTPLKIANRLFFCTPHQSVIALDATTGQEIWRYDPKIRGQLALQHLTCRGVSYYGGQPAPGAPPAAAAPSPEAQPGATAQTPAPTPPAEVPAAPAPAEAQASAENPVPDLPVAAQEGPTVDSCPAKLFMPTADGRVIALDPETGGVCTDFGGGTGQINLWVAMPNVNPGSYYSTSPVVVARGMIIVGGTVLDNVSTAEASGVIRAFDIASGRLVWNWDSGNPDDTAPLAPGGHYTPNSPNSWSISSVDEVLGMVYVPLGNQPPDQWGGNRSEAVDTYSSAVVALDLQTGRVRWRFQTVHHDLWDYDVPSQPSLVDLTINGDTVPALVQPTKQGELFVLDRRTGEPILPVEEVPAPQGAAEGDRTAPTQPKSALSFDPPVLEGPNMWGVTMFDQLACRIELKRLRYEGRYTPPSTQGTLVYPGNFGVFNWGAVSVDPQRQIVFTTPTFLAFVSRLVPRADDTTLYVQGENRPEGSLPALNENFGAPFAVQLHAFLSPLGLPCQAPPWGYVAAADLTNGQIAWKRKNGTVRDLAPIPLPFQMGVPNLGGPVTTAGGVGFLSGTLDDFVRGYNVTTGEEIWRARLPAGGQATPMTYEGADGRQYLLVVAGGHGSLGTKPGDYVIAYALPSG